MEPGATLRRVPPTALTRRRALALGAAAGTGLLLRPRLPSAQARAPRAFALAVTGADFGRLLAAPRRFQIIGAHAHGVEVRTRRRGGHWGAWVALRAAGAHGPDNARNKNASDPFTSQPEPGRHRRRNQGSFVDGHASALNGTGMP